MRNQLFQRRTFLRGLGVTMALPWLESLPVWGDDASTSTKRANEPPVRLAVLFSGNGFHAGQWWAKGVGKDMTLGPVLESLTDFRERLLFINGLYNAEALKGNIHSSQTGNLLSGAPLASGGEIRSGTSFDQLVSQHYGHTTKVYPALAFDRLFKGAGERGDRGVLDAVLGEASRFRGKISTSDQQKLDEYLNSVREVEQRLEQAGKQGELQGWRPTLDKLNVPRPPEGIPQNLADHMRLMCDILVLAFQTDATRVCTLKLNNDHSYLQFPHLNVAVGHHELSHSDRGKMSPDWLKVNQFFLEQFAYIARKLDAIQEGERTALDNSVLMYLSSMQTGSHDASNLPCVVVGGGGGPLQGGRVLDYANGPNRKMCSLYLSLLDKFGIRLKEFGDSKEHLAEV